MMQKNKKIYRIIINLILFAVLLVISNVLERFTNISNFELFDATSLFTYFGVLIGFAITIYTFGLSMIDGIKENIAKNKLISEPVKKELFDKLISGFNQIKEDIWVIFYAIIVVVCFAILKNIPCPFNLDVIKIKVPESVNLALFLYATICMYDIMKTLFNLSEINLNLKK